ncbi:MAG: shikimate kinase [Eubacterium sp.]|nr:shikimate kinase [Eubacterium sp.]
MKENITLIGMPTSGKSTAGVILAKVLGMDFVDTDLLIQKKKGKRLQKLIEENGVEGFIKIEEDVCKNLEASKSVIATGGSVIYGDEAMKHLKEIGHVIYLEIDYETLEKRLHHVKQRGVVLKPGQTKKDLYDERVALYKKYADIIISEEGLDIEGTVQEIIEKLS